MNQHRRGVLLAVLAVCCFGTGPIFTRLAGATLSSDEIAAGRLLTASITILFLAWLNRQNLPVAREWPKFIAIGLITALHFLLFNLSLEFTTIAHSLALVYTAPIFVALFSWLYLGEKLNRKQWLGTLIVIFGVAILSGFEPTLTRKMLIGDLFAIGSAITFGLYSVAGRSQRNHYSLFAYAGFVYLLASLWAMPTALWKFQAENYTPVAIACLLALGLIPLAIGHTAYNAALRQTNATVVNLIAAQETVFGIVAGILMFQEVPSGSAFVGIAVTLLGILLVL